MKREEGEDDDTVMIERGDKNLTYYSLFSSGSAFFLLLSKSNQSNDCFPSALESVCSVSPAYSSLLDLICTSFSAASFDHNHNLCSMPLAHSTFNDLICTSFNAATFDLCSMPHAHSSFLSLICAAFTTTPFAFSLCTVPNTHPSLLSESCASFYAASFGLDLCPMLNAHTPPFLA
jgi:hypothetical protein